MVRDQISVKQTVAQKGPATTKTLMDLKSNIESNDVSHQKEYDHSKQELELDKGKLDKDVYICFEINILE